MSFFWKNYTFRTVFLLFLTLKLCINVKSLYLNPAQFWSSAISRKLSSLVETKCFCSVSSAWAFCKELKQIKVLHQSYLAINLFLVDRKLIFYETELKKNIEVWHSFRKWLRIVEI